MTELTGPVDVDMSHRRLFDAPVAVVWQALTAVDMRDSLVVRGLLTMRGMRPRRPLTLAGLGGSDFRLLSTTPPTDAAPRGSIVMGLIAKPWRFKGAIHRDPVDDINAFTTPGFAVVTWSYAVEPADGGSAVMTRTAVRCTDDLSRRRFLRYWRVVGPFSGVIRRESLRLLHRRVEQLHQSG